MRYSRSLFSVDELLGALVLKIFKLRFLNRFFNLLIEHLEAAESVVVLDPSEEMEGLYLRSVPALGEGEGQFSGYAV
jgi:hypothetical protein